MKAYVFTALAFLPTEHVYDAFAQLQSIPYSDEGLQNYMDTLNEISYADTRAAL